MGESPPLGTWLGDGETDGSGRLHETTPSRRDRTSLGKWRAHRSQTPRTVLGGEGRVPSGCPSIKKLPKRVLGLFLGDSRAQCFEACTLLCGQVQGGDLGERVDQELVHGDPFGFGTSSKGLVEGVRKSDREAGHQGSRR